mmetsp:Transcript_38231/g.81256  ORF Transcript_38231/g.81256 Transcript_38231/m.81256 type:complete len:277 (-) Transcript_38231:1829-2659(-)
MFQGELRSLLHDRVIVVLRQIQCVLGMHYCLIDILHEQLCLAYRHQGGEDQIRILGALGDLQRLLSLGERSIAMATVIVPSGNLQHDSGLPGQVLGVLCPQDLESRLSIGHGLIRDALVCRLPRLGQVLVVLEVYFSDGLVAACPSLRIGAVTLQDVPGLASCLQGLREVFALQVDVGTELQGSGLAFGVLQLLTDAPGLFHGLQSLVHLTARLEEIGFFQKGLRLPLQVWQLPVDLSRHLHFFDSLRNPSELRTAGDVGRHVEQHYRFLVLPTGL